MTVVKEKKIPNLWSTLKTVLASSISSGERTPESPESPTSAAGLVIITSREEAQLSPPAPVTTTATMSS